MRWKERSSRIDMVGSLPNKAKIVIIGGRGNGTVIASTIEDWRKTGSDIECVGFLNDDEFEINGYPVLGKIRNDDWKKLPEDYKFIYPSKNLLNINNDLSSNFLLINLFLNNFSS